MGLWNLNNFPYEKLTDMRESILYKFLNSTITKKVLNNYLRKNDSGEIFLEEVIKNLPEDDEPFIKRIYAERGNFILYTIINHICKLFDIPRDDVKKMFSNPLIRKSIINIVETVVEYGVSKPMIFAEPLMVVWNITGRCNLRCQHCYEDAGILSKGLPAELTEEEKVRVMEEIVKTNIPTFAFAGGEPLMDPTFWNIAEIGKRAGLYMSINTNGTLITEEVAERLKEVGFAYYGVSLDGANAEVHDGFRGVQGSFERALAGIKNLIRVGEADKTCIAFTVARENKDEIHKMIKLRDRLGIKKIVLYNYIPCGRAGFESDISCEEREELFSIFYEDLKNGKECLLSTAPQFGRYCKQMYEKGAGDYTVLGHFSSGSVEKLENLVELIGGCGAGRAYIAIQPDGGITPCVYMPDVCIGNMKKNGEIKKENLLDIWKNSEVLNIIRERRKHPEISGCKGRYFSVCGGCVARSYAYFEDFLSPDPGCILNRDILEGRLDKEIETPCYDSVKK
ncbi:MAG: radical SAM protein [Candidatus Omnitrophica bacterium]|nr:radical SAM protein [Candidatus Omnitrophota bacterium]